MQKDFTVDTLFSMIDIDKDNMISESDLLNFLNTNSSTKAKESHMGCFIRFINQSNTKNYVTAEDFKTKLFVDFDKKGPKIRNHLESTEKLNSVQLRAQNRIKNSLWFQGLLELYNHQKKVEFQK